MKKIVIASALLMVLTGCNTLRGVGEDLQALGRWTSSSADKGVPSIGGSDKIAPVEDSYSYPGDVDSNYSR